jgi:hypothetical protein
MRRATVVLLLAIVVLLLTMGMAAAKTPLDVVTANLQIAPVYVGPTTEGPDPETQGMLLEQVTGDDRILIATVPQTVLTNPVGPETPAAFAKQIADRMRTDKSDTILGLAVGDVTVGYSTFLPSGVAADLMNRAARVSTTAVETLGAFITNVHDWQADHAAAAASTPAPNQRHSDGGGANSWWVLGTVVAIALPLLLLATVFTRTRTEVRGHGG